MFDSVWIRMDGKVRIEKPTDPKKKFQLFRLLTCSVIDCQFCLKWLEMDLNTFNRETSTLLSGSNGE